MQMLQMSQKSSRWSLCRAGFFEDTLARDAEKKNAKSKQFACELSRFWKAEIMIFGRFVDATSSLPEDKMLIFTWVFLGKNENYLYLYKKKQLFIRKGSFS